MRSHRRTLLTALGWLAASLAVGARAPLTWAQTCTTLRYTFQPDCFRAPGDTACAQTIDRLDLGPQIAIWLERADGSAFVDTLMVTNLTAARGIGNRPGIWNFPSGPWFPYGKRLMALPIWAHARGVLYQAAVMQDDREDWLGFHEQISSPDPYFCRPLAPDEINVDAISCPTRFSSAKGKLDPTTQIYYPPRNDLTMFLDADCDIVGATIPCPVDAGQFANLNDLDAVAAATPPYGAPWSGTWTIPGDLAAGDYALVVEVSKEFDSNPAFAFPAFVDENLPDFGIPGNLGQPSVIYRVPIHLDPAAAPGAVAGASAIAGYGDWTGADGDVRPPDGTISTSDPGSGEMRLLEISGPDGDARVHVVVEPCVCLSPDSLSPVTDLRLVGPGLGGASDTVTIAFANAEADGAAVASYEVRYAEGAASDADQFVATFGQAVRGPQVIPGPPGSSASFTLSSLRPATAYLAGIRAVGACGEVSPIALLAFATPAPKFQQLSGCFVATAAFGSPLAPEVAGLRRARNRLRPSSSLFAVAADLYERSGPALADLVRRSGPARALTRVLLGPIGIVAGVTTPPPARLLPREGASALYSDR